MAVIKQGDIYIVDIPKEHTVGSEQYKSRPYIIVSRTGVNKFTVVAVPLTSTDAQATGQPPYRIVIPVSEIDRDVAYKGELHTSVARTDQIRVVALARLGCKVGTLTHSATLAVCLGVAWLLDIR